MKILTNEHKKVTLFCTNMPGGTRYCAEKVLQYARLNFFINFPNYSFYWFSFWSMPQKLISVLLLLLGGGSVLALFQFFLSSALGLGENLVSRKEWDGEKIEKNCFSLKKWYLKAAMKSWRNFELYSVASLRVQQEEFCDFLASFFESNLTLYVWLREIHYVLKRRLSIW